MYIRCRARAEDETGFSRRERSKDVRGEGGREKENGRFGGGEGGEGIAKRELEMRGAGRRWSFDRAVL